MHSKSFLEELHLTVTCGIKYVLYHWHAFIQGISVIEMIRDLYFTRSLLYNSTCRTFYQMSGFNFIHKGNVCRGMGDGVDSK